MIGKRDNSVLLGRGEGASRVLRLDAAQRSRHLYTIGSTGAGKTTFLKSLILQDIYLGRGLCLIDPHGDLAEEVAAAIPRERLNETVYFDAADRGRPIGFNPLSGWEEPHERELVASDLIATFKGIWRDSWGEWLEYLLKNTFLALMERRGVAVSLLSVHRMLEDEEYRKHILQGVKDPVVSAFWKQYFDGFSTRDQRERISSTLNKAGKFVLSPSLRNIVGQTKTGFSLNRIMDEQGILIVNLAKGRIGEDNANLLGSLIVSDIVSRTMARAGQGKASRQPFNLFIDEFQNFTTDRFASIVAEARKYGLALHISHQNFDQIDAKVLSAILKNTGTLTAFSVNFEDAESLARHFRPIQASALTSSQVGEFWCRAGIKTQPVTAFPPEDHATLDRNALSRVQENSRQRHGRDKAKIEGDLVRWWGR